MPVFRELKDVYYRCQEEGNYRFFEEIDIEKIKSGLKIAKEDYESAKLVLKNKKWNSAYKLHYDVLHELVEAYTKFDKLKSGKHQCLFAYLCENYSELEFSWNFFEKIRTKRNGINYYGTPVTEDDWKEISVQLNLYIEKLMYELNIKIKNFE